MAIKVRRWATRKRVRQIPFGQIAEILIEPPKKDGSRRSEDSESKRTDIDSDGDDPMCDSTKARFDELIGSRRVGLDWRRWLEVSLFSATDASMEDTEGWMTLDEFRRS